MPSYSIRYIDTNILEQELKNSSQIQIPVDNTCTAEQIQKELESILNEFHKNKPVPEAALRYAAFAAFPSWMNEEEEVFALFEIEELP